MSTPEFVELIRKVVVDSAIRGTIQLLKNVPGRKPNPTDVSRSATYAALDEEMKRFLHEVIKESAEQTAFNFCTLLDGVILSTDIPPASKFELFIEIDGRSVLINRPEGPFLHEMFHSEP